jgi:predicted metal-binding protein
MAPKTRNREIKRILSDDELYDAARRKPGVKDVRIISPSDVVTAAWVNLKCQFGCDGYGQCLVCPPFTPTPKQMRIVLDCYHRAILIHFGPRAAVKTVVAGLERDIFLSGAWKAFGLGAGPCYFCRRCPVEEGQCRHTERARPSMEACGIDVFSTAKKAGFPIEVVRTRRQCPNYYGLILVD